MNNKRRWNEILKLMKEKGLLLNYEQELVQQTTQKVLDFLSGGHSIEEAEKVFALR